ncbi:MAG: T9SS type A sorting domain-containing protein [Chitinophagales bacterium]
MRSGEGYGIMNSLTTHFGLNTITEIDSIVVIWPSGIRDVICTPDTNSTLLLKESCKPNCEGIVLNLNETICKGESYLFNGIERTESGLYSYVTSNLTGCDSTVNLNLDVIEIDNTVTYNDLETTLTVNENEAAYQWYHCENNTLTPINEATDRSYQTEVDGEFAVVISKDGCIDTSACVNVLITCLLENLFSFDIDVFPNPLKDLLTVELSAVKDQINIQLFDLSGQLQMDENFISNQIHLSIDELPIGIYLLKITIDGEVGSIKKSSNNN